jgi:ankyrin repeat protein
MFFLTNPSENIINKNSDITEYVFEEHKNEIMELEPEVEPEPEVVVDKYELINACKNRNTTKALELIEKRECDLSLSDDSNSNALMFACDNKMTKVALALLQTGITNVSQINHAGYSALDYALYFDETVIERNKEAFEEVCILLFGHLCIENNHDNTKLNPSLLQTACSNGFDTLAMELLEAIDPSYTDNDGNTALVEACRNGLTDVAISIIRTGKSNPSQVNNINGYTALIYSCYYGYNDVVTELINTGLSNPSFVDSYGYTALIYACYYGYTDIAIELIQTGLSNPSWVDSYGYTALMYVCYYGLNNVAVELIQTGLSNPSHIDPYEYTALMYACQLPCSTTIVSKLLPVDCAFHYTNSVGENAVYFAEENEVQIVLDHDADLRKKELNNIQKIIKEIVLTPFMNIDFNNINTSIEVASSLLACYYVIKVVFYVFG